MLENGMHYLQMVILQKDTNFFAFRWSFAVVIQLLGRIQIVSDALYNFRSSSNNTGFP